MMYSHEPSRVLQSADIAVHHMCDPEARPRPSMPAGKDGCETRRAEIDCAEFDGEGI
jgi:hypothetical protein